LSKDHFYYCLKTRLEYAQEYAHDYITYLKSIEFTKKTEREFYKNKKILFVLNQVLNLPINTYKSFKAAEGKFHLKKCLTEIKVIKHELKNYEVKKNNSGEFNNGS